MKTYEVVLFENKDKTEKFVQVWYRGSDQPYYFCYTYAKILKWRLYLRKTIFGGHYVRFWDAINHSKRRDTEKFPDLEKIKKYNEARKEYMSNEFWG